MDTHTRWRPAPSNKSPPESRTWHEGAVCQQRTECHSQTLVLQIRVSLNTEIQTASASLSVLGCVCLSLSVFVNMVVGHRPATALRTHAHQIGHSPRRRFPDASSSAAPLERVDADRSSPAMALFFSCRCHTCLLVPSRCGPPHRPLLDRIGLPLPVLALFRLLRVHFLKSFMCLLRPMCDSGDVFEKGAQSCEHRSGAASHGCSSKNIDSWAPGRRDARRKQPRVTRNKNSGEQHGEDVVQHGPKAIY